MEATQWNTTTKLSEGALHDGQLLLGDAVSAAAALVGVQDSNTGVVSIPVHAAAAMMQIQGVHLHYCILFSRIFSMWDRLSYNFVKVRMWVLHTFNQISIK